MANLAALTIDVKHGPALVAVMELLDVIDECRESLENCAPQLLVAFDEKAAAARQLLRDNVRSRQTPTP